MAETLGSRLVKLRKQKGLKQKTAAERIGLPDAKTLTYYEKGDRRPKTARLKQIADFYGVSISWLDYGDDPSPQEVPEPFETWHKRLRNPKLE